MGKIPEFIELDLRPIPSYYERVKRSLELDFRYEPEPDSRVCLRFSRNHARYHHFTLEGYSCYEGEGIIKLKFRRLDNAKQTAKRDKRNGAAAQR